MLPEGPGKLAESHPIALCLLIITRNLCPPTDSCYARLQMLKLGIYKKEQLRRDHLEGFFKSRKFIALDLYNALDEHPANERDKIQERMLCRFSNKNGTFRYTHARRFDDFDRLAVKVIRYTFPPDKNIRVHDVAASDGRTSCDLYDSLDGVYGERLYFEASDYAPFLYIVRKKGAASRLITDHQDNILQIITPPFVFNVVHSENKAFYPLNYLIRHLVTRFYARPMLRACKSHRPGIERVRLELLCWECREHIARKTNFRFERFDIFSRPTHRFDVIRAMNVLNRSYFCDEDLKRVIENFIQSLNEGGLFITGSNVEAGTVVNGGIYKKNAGRLERLEVSGEGSQVDGLIGDVYDINQPAIFGPSLT